MPYIYIAIYYLLSLVYIQLPAKTYIEGVVGQPSSFLPSKAQTDIDKTISKLLYRGLFKYDNFGTLVPDLAQSWEVTSGGLVYTMSIKNDQYWSDGSKITANDLLYTSYKIPNLSGVSTDKIDDYTVRYTLPNRFSPFLSLLTVGVMKDGSDERYQGFYTPSSGPFRVASVKKKGELIKRVVLYNTVPSKIKQLVFRFYPNDEELITGYKLGEIHAFLLQENVDFKKDTNLTLYQYPIQSVYYALFFNLRGNTFKNLTLRNKLSQTLDVDVVTAGYGIPVEGPISRSSYTSEKYKTGNYNKDALYNLSEMSIYVDMPSTPALLEIAKRIKLNWEGKLNAIVSLVKHEPSVIRKDVIDKRDFEILLFGQEVGRDPDRYVNWHSTQADSPGLNLSGFNNVRADRALEEGRKELDSDVRKTHYDEFQKVVEEQTPAIFLHHPYMNYYVNNNIKGMGDKYTFTSADRFLDFNNWSF